MKRERLNLTVTVAVNPEPLLPFALSVRNPKNSQSIKTICSRHALSCVCTAAECYERFSKVNATEPVYI